jgi:hypothetical protein
LIPLIPVVENRHGYHANGWVGVQEQVAGADGATYTYCHGHRVIAAQGQRVTAGASTRSVALG